MKLVRIDNCICNEFAEEVADILESDDFNIELFGVCFYDNKLPKNCEIVDYESRETLAIIRNGEVFTSKDEIEEIQNTELEK